MPPEDLANLDHGSNPNADPSPQPTSFRERKLQALQNESDPDVGTPDQFNRDAQSEEDGYPSDEPRGETPADPSFESMDDATDEQDPDDSGALFDETPTDDNPDDLDEEPAEGSAEYWRSRFEGVEKSLKRATENRKAIEAEFAEGISTNLTMRHDLEDRNNEAASRAQFFLNLANAQVQKFEQMDWRQIDPENMPAARQQYQSAVQYRDQVNKAMDEIITKGKDDREKLKQREAEISRSMLARRIPNWSNEHYATLREHAHSLGYSPAEFNDLTDWRTIQLIHKDWEVAQAPKKVADVKRQQKARRPRNNNGRPQPRNAEGRFQSARQEAHANPGDRSKFREMKRRQLEREGSRR